MHWTGFPTCGRALKDAAWALGLPVIIVLGTIFGVATPTEIAVVAALYALFVTMVIYRSLLSCARSRALIVDTAVTTGALSPDVRLRDGHHVFPGPPGSPGGASPNGRSRTSIRRLAD